MKKRYIRKPLPLVLIFSIIFLITLMKNLLENHPEDDFNYRKLNSRFDIEGIFSPLWSVSDEQRMMNPIVLIKTLKFMIDETDETDSELIDFVRSLIIPPPIYTSQTKLTLNDSSKYKSSHTKSTVIVDATLRGKTNGFFIEAGAHDGETISNSLFFELNRNWTGRQEKKRRF